MAIRDTLPAVTALLLIIPVLLPGAKSTVIPFRSTIPGGDLTDQGFHWDCQAPMCVDPVRSSWDYCMKCPNGPNCRIPSTGEVIDAGEPVYRNGMTCECPPQDDFLPGAWLEKNYTAVCTLSSNSTAPPIADRR